MTRTLLAAGLLFFSTAAVVSGQVFPETKLADAKGKQTRVSLRFSPMGRSVFVDATGGNPVTIPYDKVDKMSYESTSRERFKEGGIVMPVALAAGALLMLTSSKSHWFTIEYHDGGVAKTLVLRLDKRDYKQVIETAQRETGQQVELLSDVKLEKRKTKK